jgi:hypothetical protein
MQGVDVFCERCGTSQPKADTSGQRSAGLLARRVLDAVGITENQPAPAEDWLRLCLTCRGYSCPTCWNDVAGVCRTCEPVPEPVAAVAPEPMPEPVVIPAPVLAEPIAPEPTPQPIPYWVSQLEPLVAARDEEPVEILEPEPVLIAEAEPEPEFVAQPEPEPEPEPVLVADAVPEPEPEPIAAVEPEPELPAPAPVDRPRMPVLPLPPPRPADAPLIPLSPLSDYPIAPQISFTPHDSVSPTSATSSPAYEAHLLLTRPARELPANAVAAGLRPCPNCSLTLSARAHFCRRCGSAQAA